MQEKRRMIYRTERRETKRKTRKVEGERKKRPKVDDVAKLK
jgi:hypothetical protein